MMKAKAMRKDDECCQGMTYYKNCHPHARGKALLNIAMSLILISLAFALVKLEIALAMIGVIYAIKGIMQLMESS
jgi:hypothetical protein